MPRYPAAYTPDLFADEPNDSVLAELHNWFEAWLADAQASNRLRQSSTESVYRAMWGGFVKWCLSQQPAVRLLTVSPDDLRLFMASRRGEADKAGNVSPRYAWDMLNLVDRVLRYAAGVSESPVNEAAALAIASLPGVKWANVAERALPDYLAADDVRQLVIFLSEVRPRGATVPTPRDWRDLRNRASVGVQLGAGLTPGEIRALPLSGVIDRGGPSRGVPWKLVTPADGNTPEHETPIARWAAMLLRHWLTVRAELGIPGDWVFPSTRTGKQWANHPQYVAVRDVLHEAGIRPAEGGSFRLRHTFALRQLRRGVSKQDLANWMGIINVEEMARYDRVLHRRVEVI
jgi:integrase